MSLSNYAEDKLVDAVVNASTTGGGLPTADIYVKLHTGDPGEDGTANAATETDRDQVAFGASSGGTAVSTAAAEWLAVAGSETYSHVSYWDHVSAGNCLGSGAMTAPKAVTAGDDFSFPIGDLSFTLA